MQEEALDPLAMSEFQTVALEELDEVPSTSSFAPPFSICRVIWRSQGFMAQPPKIRMCGGPSKELGESSLTPPDPLPPERRDGEALLRGSRYCDLNVPTRWSVCSPVPSPSVIRLFTSMGISPFAESSFAVMMIGTDIVGGWPN